MTFVQACSSLLLLGAVLACLSQIPGDEWNSPNLAFSASSWIHSRKAPSPYKLWSFDAGWVMRLAHQDQPRSFFVLREESLNDNQPTGARCEEGKGCRR
jgi:hypothetical protein